MGTDACFEIRDPELRFFAHETHERNASRGIHHRDTEARRTFFPKLLQQTGRRHSAMPPYNSSSHAGGELADRPPPGKEFTRSA